MVTLYAPPWLQGNVALRPRRADRAWEGGRVCSLPRAELGGLFRSVKPSRKVKLSASGLPTSRASSLKPVAPGTGGRGRDFARVDLPLLVSVMHRGRRVPHGGLARAGLLCGAGPAS